MTVYTIYDFYIQGRLLTSKQERKTYYVTFNIRLHVSTYTQQSTMHNT